jgi:hypothetical protein
MKNHYARVRMGCALAALLLAVSGTLAPARSAGPADAPQARAVAAKVIALEGPMEVQAPGGSPRALRTGDAVYFGESLAVPRGSSATLALSDKTLREFAGPATLTLEANAGPAGGTVLGNLTAAMADMLFSGKPRTLEAVMATRSADASAETQTSVPALIRPAPGENLMEAPRQFTWKGVDGVPLYRVSVYSANQMMWQGTTSEAKAACPAKTCDFRPGEVYYWVVEALVGNTTLRSQAADFTILSGDARATLAKALTEADAAVADRAAAAALKARLCLESGAYARALEVLDQAIAGSPSRAALVLRAEVKSTIGLVDEALADYKQALALPPGE